MGGNGHIWAEAQEVTLVGLLILSTEWDGSHTANWKQRLMGNQTEVLIRNRLLVTTKGVNHNRTTVSWEEKTEQFYFYTITGENTHWLLDSP